MTCLGLSHVLGCLRTQLLGVVAHACDPSSWEAEEEESHLKASLGYIVKPCLKIN
jgi:hypothetical protein